MTPGLARYLSALRRYCGECGSRVTDALAWHWDGGSEPVPPCHQRVVCDECSRGLCAECADTTIGVACPGGCRKKR